MWTRAFPNILYFLFHNSPNTHTHALRSNLFVYHSHSVCCGYLIRGVCFSPLSLSVAFDSPSPSLSSQGMLASSNVYKLYGSLKEEDLWCEREPSSQVTSTMATSSTSQPNENIIYHSPWNTLAIYVFYTGVPAVYYDPFILLKWLSTLVSFWWQCNYNVMTDFRTAHIRSVCKTLVYTYQ